MTKARNRIVGSVAAAFMVSAALLLTGGCATKPVELAPQATDALVTMRAQLFTGKTQIQEASNAARDLVDQPRADLTAQIKRLDTAVAALNATRAEARAGAEAQAKVNEEYFAKWDESLKSMSQETAERGQKRLALAKESVNRLSEDAANIRKELNPFMAEMNEATKYLATDTTKAGLGVIKPKLVNATRRESDVIKAIDKTIADIDAIRAGK